MLGHRARLDDVRARALTFEAVHALHMWTSRDHSLPTSGSTLSTTEPTRQCLARWLLGLPATRLTVLDGGCGDGQWIGLVLQEVERQGKAVQSACFSFYVQSDALERW